MQYEISYYCISHIGNIRATNQDNFICAGQFMEEDDKKTLDSPVSGVKSSINPFVLGVFDGMGGEERGEVASHLAAQTASRIILGKDVVGDLMEFCKSANKEICEYMSKNDIKAMGTTAAMLAFDKKGVTLCNIGDTKILKYNDDTLTQISCDHVAAAPYGVKPPLLQNLGIPETEMIIEPYFAQGNYRDGDLYLICSDGLTDMVSLEKIANILGGFPSEEAINRLLIKALKKGGKDNITIILCEIKKKRTFLHKRRNKKK